MTKQATNDQTTAYASVIDRIHTPAFLEKLASRGYTANSVAEAVQLVELGFKVASRPQPVATKAPLYDYALKAADARNGVPGDRQERMYAEAAASIAAEPGMFENVLTVLQGQS